MSKSLELPRHFQLNNGREIPSVGLGTFQSEANNDRVRDVVSNALKHGYRHIDTAADYGNEKQVGEGIRDSGVLREDMFVTTKLWVMQVCCDSLQILNCSELTIGTSREMLQEPWKQAFKTCSLTMVRLCCPRCRK